MVPLVNRKCLDSGYNIEVPQPFNAPRIMNIYKIQENTYFFQQLLSAGSTVPPPSHTATFPLPGRATDVCGAGKLNHYYTKGKSPVIISMERSKSRETQRIIIRSTKGDTRVLVSTSPAPRALKTLCRTFPDMLEESALLRVKQELPGWDKALLNFEAKQISFTEKIGIVYAGPGQTTEDEFFNNGRACAGARAARGLMAAALVNTSPEFEKFLELLGETVDLRGFDKFRGGLDVKSEAPCWGRGQGRG